MAKLEARHQVDISAQGSAVASESDFLERTPQRKETGHVVAEDPEQRRRKQGSVQGDAGVVDRGGAAAGIDLSGFDPDAPLIDRLSWAREMGLDIGGCYSRYSTKLQHSTYDQVRASVMYGARHKIYIPPEYVCVDEAVKGSRSRRKGWARLQAIIDAKCIDVLLVFKPSRLYRKAYKSMAFIEEELIEAGIRVVDVSAGIDSADASAWKMHFAIYSIFDETLVDTIADHVRESHKTAFRSGYVTGALTVGYRRKNILNGPPTKRGLPRAGEEIDPKVAKLILQHFEWISEGMPIMVGWRRWPKARWACDPRSTTGYMTPQAYRRMLSNRRYIGQWTLGRRRNRWSSKKDYNTQVEQPDDKVESRYREDLRIVSDELFFKVQKRLANEPRGRHKKRRKDKPVRLCDLVTDIFYCRKCGTRFYQHGAGGDDRREFDVIVQILFAKSSHDLPPSFGDPLRRRPFARLTAGGQESQIPYCRASDLRLLNRRRLEDRVEAFLLLLPPKIALPELLDTVAAPLRPLILVIEHPPERDRQLLVLDLTQPVGDDIA